MAAEIVLETFYRFIGMEYYYYVDNFGEDYYIPEDKIERFNFLNDKLSRSNVVETFRGYRIVFAGEFSRYRIDFRSGDLWYKVTDSWLGNGERGSLVRIKEVSNSFIHYREVKKFGIYFSVGMVYTLNKWSFLRIFTKVIKEGKR